MATLVTRAGKGSELTYAEVDANFNNLNTDKIGLAGFTLVSIASSATVNIGAATSNYITVTGTTTITAFDTVAAGQTRIVTFSGILTLTHNATSLILPWGANITTEAGDTGEFQSLGGGNWTCLRYNKKTKTVPMGGTGVATLTGIVKGNGTGAFTAAVNSDLPSMSATVGGAVPTPPNDTTKFLRGDATWVAPAGGGLIFLSLVNASSASTIDIETTFSSTYDAYVIIAEGITFSASSTDLNCRMKVGGSYDTAANYYYWAAQPTSSTASLGSPAVANGGNSINITSASNLSNTASDGGNIRMHVYNPASTTFKKCIDWHGFFPFSGSSSHTVFGGGMNTATTALTGIRLYPTSGTMSGKFRLYGIPNS